MAVLIETPQVLRWGGPRPVRVERRGPPGTVQTRFRAALRVTADVWSAVSHWLLLLWTLTVLGFAAVLLIALLALAPAGRANAADESEQSFAQAAGDERFAFHGQLTYVEQETDSFRAPYAGANSLSPASGRETLDATLFVGLRLWPSAEIWVTPEIDQGFGLDNTVGVAGFPSGEAYKVGKARPYLRLPRAFVRQVIDVGGEREVVEAAPIQLGGSRSLDRWVFTMGKFSVTDVFDTSQYAHDPRVDFLNWSAVDAGTFDYAADAWGYTVGGAVERYLGPWTYRIGAFDLSNVPNSEHLEPAFHEFQWVAEVERRFGFFDQTARALLTVFDTRGRMARLDEAINVAALTGEPPDPSSVRAYRSRLGVSAAFELPLSSNAGVFARIGKAQGNVETYEFTDIDSTAALGASIRGAAWHRAQDTFGIVAIRNAISGVRQRYFNAGGLGVLVGDGQLPHPGSEQIVEIYYSAQLLPGVFVSLNYQYVKNPGYNTDRGPASIGAVRVHAQF